MGNFIDLLTGGLAGTATSTLGNIGMALFGNSQQLKQQQKLQDMQIAGQKQMGLFNYNQQMKMWDNTNYEAQVKHMKAAGLNPALMYGMGGGGGATTAANQSNVNGGTAQNVMAGQFGIEQGLQLALLKAQKDNIEADTRNKNVEAENKEEGGVMRENIRSSTKLNLQNVKNEEVQNEILQAQRTLTEVASEIATQTQNANISQKLHEAGLAYENLNTAVMNNQITKETMNDVKKQIKANVFNTWADTFLKRVQAKGLNTNIDLMKKQMWQIQKNVEMGWTDVMTRKYGSQTEQNKIHIMEQQLDIDKDFKEGLIEIGEWNTFINGMGEITSILKGGKAERSTAITGFRR